MLWEFHSPSHGVEGPQQVETLPYDTPLAFGGSVKVLPGAETSEVSKGFQGKDPQRPWRQEQRVRKEDIHCFQLLQPNKVLGAQSRPQPHPRGNSVILPVLQSKRLWGQVALGVSQAVGGTEAGQAHTAPTGCLPRARARKRAVFCSPSHPGKQNPGRAHILLPELVPQFPARPCPGSSAEPRPQRGKRVLLSPISQIRG